MRGHRTEHGSLALERAEVTRTWLIEHGVASGLLSSAGAVAVTDAGYVTLEVIDCASGGAARSDSSAARFIILM